MAKAQGNKSRLDPTLQAGLESRGRTASLAREGDGPGAGPREDSGDFLARMKEGMAGHSVGEDEEGDGLLEEESYQVRQSRYETSAWL